MSWISENKIPAAILGVSAAGAIGLGVVLFSAYSNYGASLEEFDNVNRRLAGLKSAPLAPTPENLAAKRALVEEYHSEVTKLNTVLHGLQKAEVPMTNTEFQARLKSKIAEARKLAAERGARLPEDFNLAFDRYTAELPRSNEVATELGGLLEAIDEFVRIMLQSGVTGIDALTRNDLPSENDAPAAPAPRPSARPPARRPGAAGAPAAAVAPPLTQRFQVRGIVTTDQAALQILLSKLASPAETANMPYFPIVRLLRIENERQEGPQVTAQGAPVPVVEGGLPPATPTTPPVEGAAPTNVIEPTKPAPPDSVVVLGNEKLRVFVELDLVKFLEAKANTPAR